jgi:putative NADPH-quinone reductase
MRIQVIYCHPLEDSFNHALFRIIVETLRNNGHDVVATDLYREGFQPAMTEAERRTYTGNGYDDSAVARYVETLTSVEGVVFDSTRSHLEPNLHNIRLLGVVTTFGTPWWVVRLYAGDPGRKVFRRGLQPMCARRVSTFWLAHYDMDHSSQRSRERYLERVKARLAAIR